jgi:hypothetical protein
MFKLERVCLGFFVQFLLKRVGLAWELGPR